jgi:hypothetical protein
MEIWETEGVMSIWWRTAEPTRPVAPVSMRCMFSRYERFAVGEWVYLLREVSRELAIYVLVPLLTKRP